MTLGNRALAFGGVAVSCAGLLLGLIGAEQLLTLHAVAPAGAALTPLLIGIAALASAPLVVGGGFVCLYRATRQAQPGVAREAPASERYPHGSVTL